MEQRTDDNVLDAVRKVASRIASDAAFREKLEAEADQFNKLVENSVLAEYNLSYGDRLALLSRKRTELERRGFLVILGGKGEGKGAGYGRISDNGY